MGAENIWIHTFPKHYMSLVQDLNSSHCFHFLRHYTTNAFHIHIYIYIYIYSKKLPKGICVFSYFFFLNMCFWRFTSSSGCKWFVYFLGFLVLLFYYFFLPKYPWHLICHKLDWPPIFLPVSAFVSARVSATVCVCVCVWKNSIFKKIYLYMNNIS